MTTRTAQRPTRKHLEQINDLIARNRLQHEELKEAKRVLLLSLGLSNLGTSATATIVAAVCAHFNVPEKRLFGPDRSRGVAWPRMLAMYLCRNYTPLSLAAIGRLFNRDHTTVMHAVNHVPAYVENDPSFAVIASHVEHVVIQELGEG